MYALVLRRYMVKYLGMNCHEICGSLSKLSSKYLWDMGRKTHSLNTYEGGETHTHIKTEHAQM